MEITSLSAQQRDPGRINVFINGRYTFSLTLAQVVDFDVKVGRQLSEEELEDLEQEGQFGKVYARALEYCMMRPRSAKEVRDYLYRKTRTTLSRSKRTGEVYERQGIGVPLSERVYDKLVDKKYINDITFTSFWIEHRHRVKGVSHRKLEAELRAKGVDLSIIHEALLGSDRDDHDELRKVLAKKRARYQDPQKLMQYLARQGFRYDDIKEALNVDSHSDY